MADANATTSAICYHCNKSLTRPDINVRVSPIPTTLVCGGLAASQTTLVTEILANTLADISELDHEISRFQTAIEELELKRAALESFAKVHEFLINPVNHLPADVLSQIFQQCVIVPWTDPRWIRRDPFTNGTPMAIASVSRQWRNVALSTPRLWSAISLVLRPKRVKRLIALASMWLSRSGSSPLSIHLETCTKFRNPMRDVLDVFAIKSPRWRNIYFNLPYTMLEYMSSLKPQFPNLEMLELELWHEYEDPLTKIDLFAHAPRLHTFFAGPRVTARTLALPWNLIRFIKAKKLCFSLPSAIDLVASTPNIESCELQLNNFKSEQMPAHANVHLPMLRSVRIEFDGDYSQPLLFRALCMPNICQLSLVLSDMSWGPLLPFLVSLCSQASLHKLTLLTRGTTVRTGGAVDVKIEHSPTGKDIVQILQRARQLRVLEVLDYHPIFISDDFLQAFAQLGLSGIPVLCPNLETICFRYCPNTDLASFVLALCTRGSSGSQNRLKTITILGDKYDEASVERTLQTSTCLDELRDTGIKIQVGDLTSRVDM